MSIVRKALIGSAILGIAAVASGDVLLDQIGPMDGSALAGNTYGSMHFLPDSPKTDDLGAVDNFTLDQANVLDSVEFVLDGWYYFDDPNDIVQYEINIYSGIQAVAENLIGDLYTSISEPVFIDSWTGPGYLLRLAIDVELEPGEYFLSVIMSNPYPDNGWVGVATSELGDDSAWAVSPNGDYVFSPFLATSDNLAYRVTGRANVPAPASITLLIGVFCFTTRRRR
ncbi:MAG: hypothetical protein P8I91_05085 [Phycisphaerales bacterium]|nr:hypothetical protein [Phycisphaerales bacterium]